MVVAHCVRSPIYLEVVQMRIDPSEGCLQNVMQLSQRDVAVDPEYAATRVVRYRAVAREAYIRCMTWPWIRAERRQMKDSHLSPGVHRRRA